MCDKLQRRVAHLSKNLAVTANLYAISIQRKEIYSVIFGIKRVQFSIAIKRLVINKADYYSFQQQSEYCIAYRFPYYASVYRECFNFDSYKGILGGW